VQLTPPGSQCAITFGKGVTTLEPGSMQDLMRSGWLLQEIKTRLPGRA
jgi:hypothetical protein